MAAGKLTTTVSTKGQVILPKAIREERRWRAGTRLTIESTPDGCFEAVLAIPGGQAG